MDISKAKSPALFLDRDGIVNKNHGYVHTIDDFEFMPHIFELVKVANWAKFKVIVVTNQSGIARGYYSQKDFDHLTKWMLTQFNNNESDITDVFYCPHHPDYGNKAHTMACECRKPNTGMAVQAAKKHNIDLCRSIMVGDSATDIIFAGNANMSKAFYLHTNTQPNPYRALFPDGLSVIEVSTLQTVIDYFKS